jgi:triosephosphate isomerase
MSLTVFTNWKMNKTLQEARSFVERLVGEYGSRQEIEIIMCVPSLYLTDLAPLCRDSAVYIGGENIYDKEWGAYTGEISAPMVRSTGATHILIGHSERRLYFGDTDESVNRKLHLALENDLSAIVCIGETREERDSGSMYRVLERQVRVCFEGLRSGVPVYLAYEPRWAIGTGVTPTMDQVEEIHAFIRRKAVEVYGEKTGSALPLLYGGSVTPENTRTLCGLTHVDGVGLGGCSLDYDCFSRALNAVLACI